METAGRLRVVMEAATVLMVAEADLLVAAGADLLVVEGLRAEDLQAVTKHYFISEKISPPTSLFMS